VGNGKAVNKVSNRFAGISDSGKAHYSKQVKKILKEACNIRRF